MSEIIYIFLTIISVSFLKLIIWGDTDDKTLQKIIGGVCVFIVAIYSNDKTIFAISMFIGGLIIASEKFMQSLAAILRSDKNSIPSTIQALNNSADITVASKKEFEEETIKTERKEVETPTQAATNPTGIDFKQRLEIEEEISNYLVTKYKNKFTKHIKLENEYGQIIVDGAVHNSSDMDRLDLNNVLGLAEIQYIRRGVTRGFLEFLVKKTFEKIRYIFIKKQILIIFWSKNLDYEEKERVNNIVKSLYPKETGERNLIVGFINIDSDNKVHELYLPKLGEHVQ